MAIAYVTVGGNSSNSASSLTSSIAVSGTNTYLVVGGGIRNAGGATISSCTADGVSMTQLGSTQTDGSTDFGAFGIVAPHAGTINVVLTFTGTSRCSMVCAVYQGVDQSTPTGTVQQETDVDQTVSSATGRTLVSVATGSTDTPPVMTAAGSMVERGEYYSTTGSVDVCSALGDIDGDTSVRLQWTLGYTDSNMSTVVELLPASATPALELEGYRIRNDDGSESSASWKAAQDTAVSMTLGAARVRVLLDATNDPASKAVGLKYAVNGGQKRSVN